MIVLTQQFNDYRNINVDEIYPDYIDAASTEAYEIVVYAKYLWKAVIDYPPDIPSEFSVNWVKWGVSNKYAALDEKGATETICDASTSTGGSPYDLVMEFSWDALDTLVISNAVASGIKIEVSEYSDPDFLSPIWTYEIEADTRTCVTGWFAYFNTDRRCGVKSIDDTINLIVRPPLMIGIMRITFYQSSIWALSSVGIVFAGFSFYLGCTLFPIGVGLEDYSKHEPDEFGTVVLVKRLSRRERTLRTWTRQIDILRIEDYIKRNILGNSVLFVGDERDDSIFYHLVSLGYLEGFDTGITKDEFQSLEFDIKEMI